jgi:hypothetical protein
MTVPVDPFVVARQWRHMAGDSSEHMDNAVATRRVVIVVSVVYA